MVRDLSDPDAALAAMREKGAAELPVEALALYQEGREAARLGQRTQAEQLLQTAAALDPTFPEPHLALARLYFPGSPQRFGSALAGAVRATGASFGVQHLLLANLLFGLLITTALGSVLVVLYAAVRVVPSVHHTLSEIMQRRWFPPRAAAMVAAVLLASPILWQVGMVPTVLLYGGIMWAWLAAGDRRWTTVLAGLTVAAPVLLWGLSPVLYSPLDPGERPYLLGRAMSSPYSPELVAAVDEALAEYPNDPDLHFAAAMLEKRGGRLTAAHDTYQAALALGASEASVYNNLGVIAFLQGDFDRAMRDFEEAVALEPGRAAAHFNLSQTYAKKLFFEKADLELAQANGLAFDRVRAALRHAADNENPLIDEPLAPARLWAAAWAGPHRLPGLPSWMNFWFPGSLALLPVVSLFMFALGYVAGGRLHRALPSSACTNCGRPVCRRCLRRIRREAYCTTCGDALLRIQSAAYSKLVLDSRLKRTRTAASAFPRAAAWILPGFHASRLGRTDLAAVLLMAGSLAVLGLAHGRLPVTRLAWIENGSGPWWPELPLVLLGLVVAVSWLTVKKLRPAAVERTPSRDEQYEMEMLASTTIPDQGDRAA